MTLVVLKLDTPQKLVKPLVLIVVCAMSIPALALRNVKPTTPKPSPDSRCIRESTRHERRRGRVFFSQYALSIGNTLRSPKNFNEVKINPRKRHLTPAPRHYAPVYPTRRLNGRRCGIPGDCRSGLTAERQGIRSADRTETDRPADTLYFGNCATVLSCRNGTPPGTR